MVCSRCGTFEGDPCAVCRTIAALILWSPSPTTPKGLHQEVPGAERVESLCGSLARPSGGAAGGRGESTKARAGGKRAPVRSGGDSWEEAKKRSKKGDRKEKAIQRSAKTRQKRRRRRRREHARAAQRVQRRRGDGVSPGTSPKDKAKKVKGGRGRSTSTRRRRRA